MGSFSNQVSHLSSLQCTHWSMASKVVQLWTPGNGTSMSEEEMKRDILGETAIALLTL